MTSTDSAAVFAAVFAALYVGHMVGDHWVQTHTQSRSKGQPGRAGRLACARHVLTYTLTQAATVGATVVALNLNLHLPALLTGLAVSAGTHYIADRRTPLLAIARVMQHSTGKETFYHLGAPRPDHDDNPTLGTGAYALDQSWHITWIFVAALITAT